ncbi:rhodanese-like domain-containing protein [Marisediminicola sp. LYQ134]|uniref:rhodanese-like domain-containing protein n=1 Tax=Marisediminicola sp. LYQ134 TaxID=3391061 RepID=UPI003982F143
MSDAPGAIPTVTAAEARSAIDTGDGVLVDVREQNEWDKGHAPEASLLPMSQLSERVTELSADTRLLVVCHSGQRSARVTSALVGAGYDAVSVAGGMIAWHADGGEIVSENGETPTVD